MAFPNEDKTLDGKDGLDITLEQAQTQSTYETLSYWDFTTPIWVMEGTVQFFISVKVNGEIKSVAGVYVKVNGEIKQVVGAYVKVNGEIKPCSDMSLFFPHLFNT